MDYGWFHSNHLSSKATRRASSHQTSWNSPDCTSHWCVSQTSRKSDLIPCVHGSIFSVWLSQHHEPMDNTNHKHNVLQLSVAMGNITLVLKGEQDLISDGSKGFYHTHTFTPISDQTKPKISSRAHCCREADFFVCFQWWHAALKAVGGDVVGRGTFCLDLWEFWLTGLILPPQLEQ